MKSLGKRSSPSESHSTPSRPFFSKTSGWEAETPPFFKPQASLVPPNLQAESAEGAMKEEEEALQPAPLQLQTAASETEERKPEPEPGTGLQAKLTVGAPNDPFEREADAVADQVVQRMETGNRGAGSTPLLQAQEFKGQEEEKETLNRQPEDKEEKENLQAKPIHEVAASDSVRRQPETKEEEEQPLQTKRTSEGEAPSTVRQGLQQTKGVGQAMAPAVQTSMEEAIGRDLSEVRLHTDDNAQAMNRDLNARAFTHGRDIYFNRGEFNTESREGQHLLSHELAHVVQQNTTSLRDGGNASIQRSTTSDELAQVWDEGRGHDAFFERLRCLKVSDPDVVDFVERMLQGNDLLLARNLLGTGPGVRPTKTSVSFTLPANLQLTGDWNDISTTGNTEVSLILEPTGIRAYFLPPLRIDIQYPVSDIALQSMTYDFASGSVTEVDTKSTQGLAIPGGHSEVRTQLSKFFIQLTRGTRVATAGYAPLSDPDPSATLNAIRDNWTSMPSSGSEVKLNEILNVELSLSVIFDRERRETTPEGGIMISAGGNVSISVLFSGTASDVMQASERQIRRITISSDSIVLQRGGSDVAKLKTIYVDSGGVVHLGRFEPLGGLETAAEAESLVRFMALLIALRSGSPEDRMAGEGRMPNLNPEIVGGIAARKIEEALGNAIRGWLRDNCTTLIPDINICKMLGISEH